MPTKNKEEYQRQIAAYLEAHKADYTEVEYEFLKRNTAKAVEYSKGFFISDILRQVLTELDLLDDDKSMYRGFVEQLSERFDIDRDIVEVAGGIIPSLAKMIALKQKTGTITVYDPRIIKPDNCPENLIVKRQQFNRDTKIPQAKMIIGFMPCEVAIDIVEAACENEIDFAVALCEGGNRAGYGYLEEDDEWIGMIEYIAKNGMSDRNMGKLKTFSLEKYGNPYPVIYNERKES